MGYSSPFLVGRCNRLETEAQNRELEGTIALMLPLALEQALQTQTSMGARRPGMRGQFVVGFIRIQYCTGHPRVWEHIPFQTGQLVVTAGDCRPSVAKSDVLKRCPKQLCLCEISQLKTLFFFTSCGGGSNKTCLWTRWAHQFASSAPDPSCYSYIVLPIYPQPYQSKLDSYRKDFSLRE